METIGFVGLGTMGSRNVRNLLAGGYELVVYDVDARAVEALKGDKVEAAGSPGEVAKQVDVLLMSVPDSPQVFEVANGPGGIAEGAHEGLVVVDLSTVAPMTPQQLAPEFEKLGTSWLDAPVSGGPAGAEAATLTIMIGGSEEAFTRVRPVLETIGKNIEYMGPTGMGATTKIVNQLAIGIQMLSMFEAFTVGVKAGIDARRLFEVLSTSSSRCWVMENLVKNVVLENRFEENPWFALRLMHKDLRIAVDTAAALDVPAAAASLSQQMFAIAEGLGWGEHDHMAAIRLYANWAGIDRW